MLNNVKKNSTKYRCFFCNSQIKLLELQKVDMELEETSSEHQELILDHLPKSENPRKKPFTHKSNYGYEVLNICKKCYERALNSYENS
jgi:hypothetical protein